MAEKVSISVIGDAFADILCFTQQQDKKNDKQKSEVVPLGGCILIDKPIETKPGGSGINTATFLKYLMDNFPTQNVDSFSLEVQTLLNPNDSYGKMLSRHCESHGISLMNCLPTAFEEDGGEIMKNSGGNVECTRKGQQQQTPHVLVLVTPQERSFIAHLGCLSGFQADYIKESFSDSHHHHIHIAGYYNIQGFWDDRLLRKLKYIRNTTTASKRRITVSLVPQYDSLETWDSGILSLLHVIDFLIMSENEAEAITRIPLKNNKKEENSTEDMTESMRIALEDMAKFFSYTPQTKIIITLGEKGAVALYDEKIQHFEKSIHVPEEKVVDPTGAGDAFAAGFVYGFLQKQKEKDTTDHIRDEEDKCIRSAMKYGCVMGAYCVMEISASSVPKGTEKRVEIKQHLGL